MKRLIIFLLLLSGVAYGQQTNSTNTKFSNGLAVPDGATNKPTSGLTVGAMFYKTGTGLQVYNGTTWITLGVSGDGVTSFNGRTGAVVPLVGDYPFFPLYDGTGATGTWGIGITGNAGTVTNGVYTTGTQTIPGYKTFTPGITLDGGLVLKTSASDQFASTGYGILYNYNGGLRYSNGSGHPMIWTSSNTAARTYTFPNASGTVALTSDIPAAGNYIQNQTAITQTAGFKINGIGTSGYTTSTNWSEQPYVVLTNGGSGSPGITSGSYLFTSSNKLGLFNHGKSFSALFDYSATSQRTYTFPDATGTVVLNDNTAILTNKSGNISQWTNDSNYITPTSTNTLTNKSGNISQWTNDSGYLTSASGVSSLTGTADEVTVSASTGAVTISLPATINANTTGNAATATLAANVTNLGTAFVSTGFQPDVTSLLGTYSNGYAYQFSASAVQAFLGITGGPFLPLAGGTLTGTLNGTKGIFSSFSAMGANTPFFTMYDAVASGELKYASVASVQGYLGISGGPFLPLTAGSGSPLSGSLYLTPNAGANRYIVLQGDDTLTGALVLQAGGGSSGFGGALNLFSHSHATRPGWITAGISAASGGKFSVNNEALSGGTDVFTVDISGNTVQTGSGTFGGKLAWGTGTYTSGVSSLFNTAADGTILVSKTGSVNDFVLTNGIGQSVFEVPTGTKDLKLYGALTGTSATFDNTITSGNGTVNAILSYNSLIGYSGTSTNHPYALYTNNAERLRVDATGNVGIGTTSAINGARLSVIDNSGNPQLTIGQSGSSYSSFYTDASNNLYIQPGGVTALTIASNQAITAASTVAATGFNVTTGGTGFNLNSGDAIIDYTSASVRLRTYNGSGYITPLTIAATTGVATFAATPILTTTPTTSAGTYDILTRNTSTGSIEKVASSGFVPYTGATSDVNLGIRTLSGGQGVFSLGVQNDGYQTYNTTFPNTTYATVIDDNIILADSSGGAYTITLSSASIGRVLTIKKMDASANNITITPASGNIDGSASKILSTQYSGYTLIRSGSNWSIIATF